MDDSDKMERVCGYLRLIERTRLLKNTTEELADLVGFSVGSGNGLVRMGGKSLFIKDAIFRELAHIVKQETDLDLQKVVEAYVGADSLCKQLGKVADAERFCQHLVWYFYGDMEATDDIAGIVDEVEAEQVPVLILLLLKALPRLSAKGGDVKGISGDYHRLFALLSETVNNNITMQKLPLLVQKEDEVRRNPKVMSRIHLVYATNLILNSYGALSTKERISISNKELAENQFEPMVEGLWVENEHSTVFWQFESIANGYHLYRYQLDSDRCELAFTKYFAKFYHTENGAMMLLIHPHAIRYMVTDRPLPNNLFAYLDCDIKDDAISFTPQSAEAKWFALRRLQRSGNETTFKKLIDDERWEKKDSHADDAYDFTLSLAAITSDHIYIYRDEATYYKVPKSLNSLLDEVGFQSNAGVLAFRSAKGGTASKYVCFDDCNLYYDVSTPAMMAEQRIEVVDVLNIP